MEEGTEAMGTPGHVNKHLGERGWKGMLEWIQGITQKSRCRGRC